MVDELPVSVDHSILRSVFVFSSEALSLVEGNIGRAIVKVSALQRSTIYIRACKDISAGRISKAFESGELNEDMVAVSSVVQG